MQLRLVLLLSLLFLTTCIPVQAANFTFSFGTPTQCDNFPISWAGGTPPFSLLLAPELGTPRAFDIPASAFNNGRGSFQAQIPFTLNTTFLAIMSDAAGFGSGGVTSVLTVGESPGNTNCNTTDPGPDFFFELNSALQQCGSYVFSGYDAAIQPITILGVIPDGETFTLNPPVGPASYQWIADLTSGESVMFIINDSKGRRGGSSDVRKVSQTSDTSCLDAKSPVSLSVAPSATASLSSTASSGASSATSSSTSLPSNDSKKSNTGDIIGGTVAAVFGLCAVLALAWFFLRRRRQRESSYDGVTSYEPRRGGRMTSVDLDPPVSMSDTHAGPVPLVQPFPYTPASIPPGSGHYPSPSSHNLLGAGENQFDTRTAYTSLTNPNSIVFTTPSEYSAHSAQAPLAEFGAAAAAASTANRSSTHESRAGGSMSNAARSKAQMAGISASNRPTRYYVHQDLEEVAPADEGEEVVELPPQYSERRAPQSGISQPSRSSLAPTDASHPLDHQHRDSDLGLQRPIIPTSPITTSSASFYGEGSRS